MTQLRVFCDFGMKAAKLEPAGRCSDRALKRRKRAATGAENQQLSRRPGSGGYPARARGGALAGLGMCPQNHEFSEPVHSFGGPALNPPASICDVCMRHRLGTDPDEPARAARHKICAGKQNPTREETCNDPALRHHADPALRQFLRTHYPVHRRATPPATEGRPDASCHMQPPDGTWRRRR